MFSRLKLHFAKAVSPDLVVWLPKLACRYNYVLNNFQEFGDPLRERRGPLGYPDPHFEKPVLTELGLVSKTISEGELTIKSTEVAFKKFCVLLTQRIYICRMIRTNSDCLPKQNYVEATRLHSKVPKNLLIRRIIVQTVWAPCGLPSVSMPERLVHRQHHGIVSSLDQSESPYDW
jgi:hypothetical protein